MAIASCPGRYPQATQQMLDDIYFNAESWLAERVATEFARAEGAAFVSGNGTNQPTGFLNGTPGATADGMRAFGVLQYLPTGVSGAWPASNPADLLLAVVFSVKAQFRQNASWGDEQGHAVGHHSIQGLERSLHPHPDAKPEGAGDDLRLSTGRGRGHAERGSTACRM